MTQKMSVSAAACPPGTLPGGPTRTRFFDGMFLTQADLENEQRYWRLKRRLTNRALGEGVVWGLALEWNQRKHTFRLAPGYALDCCGNDLVVECPLELSEQELWARADPALGRGKALPPVAGNAAERDGVSARQACIVLQYVECPEEARPVHRDACAGPTGYCEPSRIRESVRLLLVPPPKKPPPTPPELFLEELYRWRDSLPSDVRSLLFPNPGAAAPLPATGTVPLELRVTVPGTPAALTSLQVPASGSVSAAGPVQADQVISASQSTGIVTFELHPSPGWSLTAGRVTDQGRVVETVTPPAAPSMYWALDLALPPGTASATTSLEFVLDDLELSQTFGDGQRGRVRAHITARATITRSASTVHVSVEGLTIRTERADVFAGAESRSCFEELLPWGWTVDPANGSKLGRVLLLGAVYAVLTEMVRAGRSPATRDVAGIVYTAVWYALFGVNAGAAVGEEYRRKLAEHILALYQRWCRGFLYPGPRCSEEHHGVYLGCAELSQSGSIVAFDVWEHRRSVLTGPLLTHWAGQFAIAPLDVIVGRFASVFCCLAGLPAIVPEASRDALPLMRLASNRIHMGSVGSVADFAREQNASVSWLAPNALGLRTAEAFVAGGDGGALEVLASALPGGGSFAIAVPRKVAAAPSSRVEQDVKSLLRQGEQRVRESGRSAVADFTAGVLRTAPASALVNEQTPAATRKLANAATKNGATVADIAEQGTDATLKLAALGTSPEMREAAAELVDSAEHAVERVAQAAVKVLGAKLDRGDFAVAAHQQKLAESIARKIIPQLPAEVVVNAARRTGGS